jgi:Fur family ferric uptake transcriptional regulator
MLNGLYPILTRQANSGFVDCVIDNNLEKLNSYIEKKGLRNSTARDVIAKEFFKTKDHITIEDLLKKTRKINPKIGIATVYRTINLLQECGLAVRRDFNTGIVAFEPQSTRHHDHLICTSCGLIIEFFFEEIEQNQEKVAQKYGFVLKNHKMELYGICKNCRKSPASTES